MTDPVETLVFDFTQQVFPAGTHGFAARWLAPRGSPVTNGRGQLLAILCPGSPYSQVRSPTGKKLARIESPSALSPEPREGLRVVAAGGATLADVTPALGAGMLALDVAGSEPLTAAQERPGGPWLVRTSGGELVAAVPSAPHGPGREAVRVYSRLITGAAAIGVFWAIFMLTSQAAAAGGQ